MALTKDQLESRPTQTLVNIQKSSRGIKSDSSKLQFDLCTAELSKRGVESIPWDINSTVEQVPSVMESDSYVNPVACKALAYIPKIPVDTDVVDNITIRELDVARKHLNLYSNSLKRGKEFNLRLSDTRNLITAKRCAYTGVAFSDAPNNHSTVDRIDASKGYVRGNVVSVTGRINSLKASLLEDENSPLYLTMPEFEKFANAILSNKDDS